MEHSPRHKVACQKLAFYFIYSSSSSFTLFSHLSCAQSPVIIVLITSLKACAAFQVYFLHTQLGTARESKCARRVFAFTFACVLHINSSVSVSVCSDFYRGVKNKTKNWKQWKQNKTREFRENNNYRFIASLPPSVDGIQFDSWINKWFLPGTTHEDDDVAARLCRLPSESESVCYR